MTETITATASGYARYQEFRGGLMEFTEQERIVLQKLIDAWNEFAELPNEHLSDNQEFRKAIHEAQLLILARPGRRFLNSDKTSRGGLFVNEMGKPADD